MSRSALACQRRRRVPPEDCDPSADCTGAVLTDWMYSASFDGCTTGKNTLLELHQAVMDMGGTPRYEAHDDFIIYPL